MYLILVILPFLDSHFADVIPLVTEFSVYWYVIWIVFERILFDVLVILPCHFFWKDWQFNLVFLIVFWAACECDCCNHCGHQAIIQNVFHCLLFYDKSCLYKCSVCYVSSKWFVKKFSNKGLLNYVIKMQTITIKRWCDSKWWLMWFLTELVVLRWLLF